MNEAYKIIIVIVLIFIAANSLETALTLLILGGAAFGLKKLVEELDRKQAIAKEKKRKQKLLEAARKNKNIFIYDASKAVDAMQKQSKQNNLERFAQEIETQFKAANARLESAELLINDEISKLYSYQKKIYDEKIVEYENLIQPFKQSLPFSHDHKSKSVSAVSDFTVSQELAPDILRKDLDVQLLNLNKSLINISRKIGDKWRNNKLSKEEVILASIETLVATGLTLMGRAEKRKILQKTSNEVGEVCHNFQNVIRNYEAIQSKINQKYVIIKSRIDSLNKLLPKVKNIRNSSNIFSQIDELDKQEIKYINDLYFYNEDLKKLLKMNIFH